MWETTTSVGNQREKENSVMFPKLRLNLVKLDLVVGTF